MKQRYVDYMKGVHPRRAFLDGLEAEMNRTLQRGRRRIPQTRMIAAAAAAVALAVIGLRMIAVRPTDVIGQPPVVTAASALPDDSPLSQGSEPECTPAPTDACSDPSESGALFALQMIEEDAPEAPAADANPWYGCRLLTCETLTVYAENSTDSEIAAILQIGDAIWYDNPDGPTSDGSLQAIRWWNGSGMQTGWAGGFEPSDAESPLRALECTGKIRAPGVAMRYGAAIRSPEIARLDEGQYLSLYYQYGNWVFASTAPYDQTGEAPDPPAAGWIHVQDLWGIAAPSSEPTASSITTADDMRLELAFSGGAYWTTPDIVENSFARAMMFEDNLVGAHDSLPLEIRSGPDPDSPLIATLLPGTAYWLPDPPDDLHPSAVDSGCLTVRWLDEGTNELVDGWMCVRCDGSSGKDADNPVEPVQLPGRVCAEGACLRYGRSEDAPVIAELEVGQKLRLAYRAGNWIYASTEHFLEDGEAAATGWIHISEVEQLQWRTSIHCVELLADAVNVRDQPDGEIVATITREAAAQGAIRYGGATVPGQKGDWHYVILDRFSQAPVTGYISADLAHLNTFALGDELSLDGVVSCTLRYASAGYADGRLIEETISGERLHAWLARLSGASSAALDEPVCGEGAASLTLVWEDGREAELPLSGDSCTRVRHEDVTYDLRTPAERTAAFLNDGGVNLFDILPQYFDAFR